MSLAMLIAQISIYTFTTWLGCYLLARNLKNVLLRYAGLGLVSYGLALAFNLLLVNTPDTALAMRLTWWQNLFLLCPALFWVGTIIHLLPVETPLSERLAKGWAWGLVPLTFGLYLFGTLPQFNTLSPLFFAAPLVLLGALGATLFFFQRIFQTERPQKPLGLILAVTLLFTLGLGLFFFPLNFLPRGVVLFAIGLDLEILGFAIAGLDAFDEGEAFLPDVWRSFYYTLFTLLLFGGLVVLTIVFSTGITPPLLTLLLAMIMGAILWQTLSPFIELALDRIALINLPPLQKSRFELRAAANALPRVKQGIDFTALDPKEFARLTRRALSHFGDLPRLASSPLTQLPLIDVRLEERATNGDTLERVGELKVILAQSICHLKPLNQGDFGTSDEWRYYNALYFPYVLGLKPYSRRTIHDDLDPIAEEALTWFQTAVPPRTLYNWQNAAAKLIALDLREKMSNLDS